MLFIKKSLLVTCKQKCQQIRALFQLCGKSSVSHCLFQDFHSFHKKVIVSDMQTKM